MNFDLRPTGDRELHVLLHCARGTLDRSRASEVTAIVAGGIDWDRLLQLARRNGLWPLLAWHLPRICPALIPAATLAALRDYETKNSAFSLLLTGELLRLLAALRSQEIEAVPFKGPALAATLYGHVARRQFGDLDILVRPRDVWRASAAIAAQGFTADITIPEHHRQLLLRESYVQMFRRDAGRTLVELHWGIAPRAYAVPFDADMIWPRLTTVSLLGTTVMAPGDEDLLLMLCVHGARHGWDKLEGLAAIAALLERATSFDWDYVWHQAHRMRSQRIVAFPLVLVSGLFGLSLPDDAAARCRSLRQSRRLRALAQTVVRDFHLDRVASRTTTAETVLQLSLKDSLIDRARYCARACLTSTADDWAAVRLRGPLARAYPFVRALRVVRRYGASQQPAEGE
jgi:hypothetical protein